MGAHTLEAEIGELSPATPSPHTRSISARIVEADASAHVIPKSTSLVVLDPPRDGARLVCEALAARPKGKAPAIVYVACDPPTLARDVKTLVSSGYAIGAIETFEMFPHTSHVETVVTLERKAP